MSYISDNPTDRDLLADESAVELRAQRVWRYGAVMWLTWNFFAIFYWCRGYQAASLICVADSICQLLILIAFRNSKRYSAILNLSLTLSLFGLVSISASDPILADSIWFMPISIVVAYQLLGVRAACAWLILSLLSFVFSFVGRFGFEAVTAKPQIDHLILVFGVPSCLFFCCQQGERSYQQRTKDLFQLSQELQKKSRHLERLAATDELTGLSNRFQFKADLNKSVEHSATSKKRIVLFLIDMDGFKEVNDTMGHAVGDAVLVEVAGRLRSRFSTAASVSRLGGDEFCLIFSDVENNLQAESIARQIWDVLTERYVLRGGEFVLGASVGYAFCPDHSNSSEELLAFADTAMFSAKDQGIGYACYKTEMTDRLVEHRSMQEKLSKALDRNEFFLVYQPQVCLESGRVIGVEALLRWRHDGEVIPPQRFIHLLEESQEIIPVSKWVIRESCRQLAGWQKKGHDVDMSINVSAIQFGDRLFGETLAWCLLEFDVDPTRLDLEITEGLLIDDVSSAIEKLDSVKAMGVKISIDDFGTGYSSLAYLRQFPIDRLKIDRTFIKDIPDEDDGTIAHSIIALSKSLGLKVLAEGVETVEHVEFLQFHGCDEYQGFYFSPPVSAEDVEQLFVGVEPCEVRKAKGAKQVSEAIHSSAVVDAVELS